MCVYVLIGTLDARSVARGGKTGEPLIRPGAHLGAPEFRHLTHVAIIAGERFTKDDVAALEYLVLRQIAAAGAMNPRCQCLEILQLTPSVWSTASDAFLFLRWALEKARIKLLEPCSPQYPASLEPFPAGLNRLEKSESWVAP